MITSSHTPSRHNGNTVKAPYEASQYPSDHSSAGVAPVMKSVLSFAFDEHDIRVIRNESNEPWFVASDVCNALDIGNVTMALERLDADDLSSTEVMDSTNRFQKTRVVSQSGLFELVAGSRKPQAKPFRKWVFGTVLPSIAKTSSAGSSVTIAIPLPHSTEVSSKPMFLSDQFEAYLKVVEMELDGRVQRLVDLRSLHEKLGVRDNYRDWAPRSLTNSRSVEGVHYSPRVDPRAVPHSSGRAQKQVSKDYFVCFEKAKIIAARSNAENSLDICEWLVRVEEQVRQQTASNAPQSRIELARQLARTSSELVATLEREEVLSASVNRLSHTIASNVLTPRPAFEENAEGIALQRIKREIAPYLSVKVIAHVLKHFGQKRTYVQYGGHENQVVKPFVREGVENAIAQFLDQAERRVSYSRKTVVLTHDCLLGDEALISAEDAVEYLGYSPDDFSLANS